MVKVGFICEGDTEFILLNSSLFKTFLNGLNIEVTGVINAKGSGNLLPHNIQGYTESLTKQGSKVIVILTDLENDPCITETKKRISARADDFVVIAVRTIEAWFLANSPAMNRLLGVQDFQFQSPEAEANPFETINGLLIHQTGRGIGKKSAGKVKLISRLVTQGFKIEETISHSHCDSAKYFQNKLETIGKLP
jgi:hypothetical protein